MSWLAHRLVSWIDIELYHNIWHTYNELTSKFMSSITLNKLTCKHADFLDTWTTRTNSGQTRCFDVSSQRFWTSLRFSTTLFLELMIHYILLVSCHLCAICMQSETRRNGRSCKCRKETRWRDRHLNERRIGASVWRKKKQD